MRLLGAFELFFLILGIAILVAVPLALLFASGILGSVAGLLSETDLSNISIDGILSSLTGKAPPDDALSADAQRYYQLKNVSCATLSGDFQMAMKERSEPQMFGLIEHMPEEAVAAEAVLSLYRFNGTGRIYVKGDQMKIAEDQGDGETIRIWKGGRLYTCSPSCTMSMLTDEESDRYYDSLSGMRHECMHFGGTRLPESADLSLLLDIEKTGLMEINGMRCEMFLISANSSYAEGLLEDPSLNEDQRALLWGLMHLDPPMEECLDESTGLTVRRSYSLDMTGYYLFDYLPGGRMILTQDLDMTYFTTDVKDSFFDLPS